MSRTDSINHVKRELCLGTCASHPLFPTCQVRVVRFYHSCSASSASSSSFLPPSSLLPSSPIFIANLLRRSCLASSGSQCAPLDLNRKDPLAVCTPGPQPQGSDRSVHAWTSTARIRSQCAPLGPQPQGSARSVHPWTSTARIPSQCAHLDLNRKGPIAVCIPGPQPQGSDRSVHPWTSPARIRSQCAPLDLNQIVCQIKTHKHTITNTRPQTHNHKHTTTNTITTPQSQTQSQTHSYKHNYKDTIANT